MISLKFFNFLCNIFHCAVKLFNIYATKTAKIAMSIPKRTQKKQWKMEKITLATFWGNAETRKSQQCQQCNADGSAICTKKSKEKCKQKSRTCHEVQKFASDTPAKITAKMKFEKNEWHAEWGVPLLENLFDATRRLKACGSGETLFSLQLFNLYCKFSNFLRAAVISFVELPRLPHYFQVFRISLLFFPNILRRINILFPCGDFLFLLLLLYNIKEVYIYLFAWYGKVEWKHEEKI